MTFDNAIFSLAGTSEMLVQPWLDSHYFRFNYGRKYSMWVCICHIICREKFGVYISGTGLARSLIAINHCQNSATCRTTRAAGYHHQSRVLRDQRDKRSTGTGEGTEWDIKPVRYFRKLGPTIPVAFTWIHRITNTNSIPREYKQWHKAVKKVGEWAE